MVSVLARRRLWCDLEPDRSRSKPETELVCRWERYFAHGSFRHGPTACLTEGERGRTPLLGRCGLSTVFTVGGLGSHTAVEVNVGAAWDWLFRPTGTARAASINALWELKPQWRDYILCSKLSPEVRDLGFHRSNFGSKISMQNCTLSLNTCTWL